MLLIIVLGLIAKLTSVSGDCDFGAGEVKDFDFFKVCIIVLTSEMDDCDWNELSVVVLTVFLKVSTLILMLRFIFHLWINRAYHTEYVRVIE